MIDNNLKQLKKQLGDIISELYIQDGNIIGKRSYIKHKYSL